MLHELLFMLNGYHGSLFVQREDGEIFLLDDLPFITPSETAIVNRLCQLGSYYKRFLNFAESHSLPTAGGKAVGLYMRAFAVALPDALEPYRIELVKLEKELLEDEHLSLTYVQCRLEEYHLVFPALWNIVKQVSHQNSSLFSSKQQMIKKARNKRVKRQKKVIKRLVYPCNLSFSSIFFVPLLLCLCSFVSSLAFMPLLCRSARKK